MFRFTIPNVGNFVVAAGSKGEAATILQKELARLGYRVNEPSIMTALDDAFQLTPQEAEAQISAGDRFLQPAQTTHPGGGQTPVATPGPSNPPPSFPANTETGVLDPEAVSLIGTFREQLRRGSVDPDSLIGGFAQNRFQPLADTFALTNLIESQGLAPVEGGGGTAEQLRNLGAPGQFQKFVQSRGLTGGAREARAGLSAISGATSAQAGENSFLGALRQAAPGTDLGDFIASIAREALGTTLSPAARSIFAPAALRLAQRRFQDELARGALTGQAPTFAGHLQSQLGIR